MQVHRRHKFLVLGVVVVVFACRRLIVRERARAGSPGSRAQARRTTMFRTLPSPPSSGRRLPLRFPSRASSSLTRTSNCTPRLPATSSNINVDIGDHVHTGQVLAVLEIPELVAQVDEAKAAVHHAEEEIQRAHSDVVAGGGRQCRTAFQRRTPGQYRQGSAGPDCAAGTGRCHRQRSRLAGAGRCRQVGAGRRQAAVGSSEGE